MRRAEAGDGAGAPDLCVGWATVEGADAVELRAEVDNDLLALVSGPGGQSLHQRFRAATWEGANGRLNSSPHDRETSRLTVSLPQADADAPPAPEPSA